MRVPEYEERHRICGLSVTLDGEPARLVGAKKDVATVITCDGARHAEWSWRSAALIVENGGDFRTR
jgi:hypothetical protein